MAAKRLRVRDHTKSRTEYGFDFLLASSKEEFLKNITAFLGDVSDDVKIEVDNFDGSGQITLTSFRDETDAEMEKRLARAKKRREQKRCYNDKLAQKQRAQELAELARLQKKYAIN
jgi:predicted RNA-binding protein with RPS1 domain